MCNLIIHLGLSLSWTCRNSDAEISPLILMTDLINSHTLLPETFHFWSVSNVSTSILSDISITLRKTHEAIFVGYFWKITNTCERYFGDISEMSRNRHLFWDMLEMSWRRHTKEMCWRRLKDVTKKSSLLRWFWEVSEMSLSMKIWLRSLRNISCWLG